MSVHELFTDGTLSQEQWQQVQSLSTTLTPDQARWLSGYFAGLDAGMKLAGGVPLGVPEAPSSQRTLTILYGTETGNCRDLAKTLAASAAAKGLKAETFDMADYKQRRLKDEQDMLMVVSTYGEGDPPQPSVGFFEFLEGRKAPKLEGVRYSVLALGDSTYEKYCEAGKRVDARLEELGAKRIHDRVDCDIDYEEPAAAWSRAVVDLLAADLAAAGPALAVPAMAAAPAAASAYDKKNPFRATVIENMTIVGRHSSKETRHIEIDLSGSGLTYEPGDALGIAAVNDAAVVEQLLGATGLAGDAPVTVKGESLPLAEALRSRFEISIASPRFIDQWAKLTGSAELEQLRTDEQKAERMLFLHNNHVVDIVRQFPLRGVEPETFLAGLRPLQPRLYSIASSLAAAPDEAHLTVAPVRYELHREKRAGVASSQLAERLDIGETVPVYIQHNPHFALPKSGAPIVMIGAGTGVAPYRGFCQEREVTGNGGKSWIFFGERNFRSDFLYQTEWQQWLKDGVLTRMDVAFSRDPGKPKTYVQHRMLEQAKDLYAWIEEGAHVYVCGDEKSMARDVHETLIEIVAQEGRVTRETAEAYVKNLASDHRYQRDVY